MGRSPFAHVNPRLSLFWECSIALNLRVLPLARMIKFGNNCDK
jgi:hypothetical protein